MDLGVVAALFPARRLSKTAALVWVRRMMDVAIECEYNDERTAVAFWRESIELLQTPCSAREQTQRAAFIIHSFCAIVDRSLVCAERRADAVPASRTHPRDLECSFPYPINNNNSTRDSVYGAVIMMKSLREFSWFIWWL